MTAKSSPRKGDEKPDFAFNKQNYTLVIIGLVILAFGLILLIGGGSDITFARVARYADGYVHGGGPPRVFARVVDKVRAAWTDAGRPGRPHLWAQQRFNRGWR